MIRVGVGGWTFEPWRKSFYPEKLPKAQELSFASRHLTSIEVNGTFYRTQTPSTFRKWAAETPADFVFALKGPGYVVNRSELRENRPHIQRFVESGITELGKKLGPILWQLPPTRKFDEAELGAFLELLPANIDGAKLLHALEVRHASFLTRGFVTLMRRFNIPVVYAEAAKYPEMADATGEFIYARLQRSSDDEPAGYSEEALDQWAKRFRQWESGGAPADLPFIEKAAADSKAKKRDCYVYFISGAKARNPAAAMALIERIANR